MIEANARANGVEVDVRAPSTCCADEPPWAPTVVANLTLALLHGVAARLERLPERLIAVRPAVALGRRRRRAFAPLREAEPRELEGEWAAWCWSGVIRLAVRVARDHAELVLAELAELAPAGLEERDVDADTVEYVLYGAPGELPAAARRARGGRRRARRRLDHASSPTTGTSAGAPSTGRRGRGVRPALRVRPPWEPPRDGALDVVIEPGAGVRHRRARRRRG